MKKKLSAKSRAVQSAASPNCSLDKLVFYETETRNQCHILVNNFEKAEGKKKNICKQFKSRRGEFLMKGKSMSQKKLLRPFLRIQALYSRAVRVLL